MFMIKKFLSLLLTFIMVITLFASCAAPKPTPVDSSGSGNTALPTVEIGIELTNMPPTLPENQTGNFINDYIQDKFNIRIRWIPSNPEQKRLALNTGTAGDIVSIGMWLGLNDVMENGAKEGVFNNLSTIVNNNPGRYPTLEHSFQDELYKYFNKHYTTMDDIYAVWAHFQRIAPYGGILYNMQIMNELGQDFPVTVDDYESYLKLVKENMPGIIPMGFRNNQGTGWGDIDLSFFRPYGLIMEGIDKAADGTWKNFAIDDANIPMWTRLAGWYADGLIDMETFTRNADIFMLDVFVVNNMASALSSFPNATNDYILYYPYYIDANPEIDINDVVDYVQLSPWRLSGPAGKGVQRSVLKSIGYGSVIPMSSKNPERALDILNWMLSDEGQTISTFGLEGVHYESMNEKGQITGFDIDKYNADNDNWGVGGLSYHFAIININGRFLPDRFGWSGSIDAEVYVQQHTEGIVSSLPKAVIEYHIGLVNEYKKDIVELSPYYNTLPFSDEYKDRAPFLNEIKNKYFVGFMFGTFDPERDWDAFVNEMIAAGSNENAAEYGRLLEEAERNAGL